MRRGATAASALTLAGPLEAFAANRARGRPTRARGFGPLRETRGGDLLLPEGFLYRIISRQGRIMSDGNPTPGICDGMAAFPGRGGRTILMRNHENRFPFIPGGENETPVVVPRGKGYDQSGVFNAGVTKLVVSPNRRVERDFAVLGGTTTNCAGGTTPWGSWITCEESDVPPQGIAPVLPPFSEVDLSDIEPHGYIFEVDAGARGAVRARPIKSAGRFYHEAVAWHRGRLYLTEDFDIGNPQEAVSFYRYTPSRQPRRVGDLARTGGRLQALRIRGRPDADLRTGQRVGRRLPVQWVTIEDPDPPASPIAGGVRLEAFSKGAARFTREEGLCKVGPRIYFDCTDGGDAEHGQIWEYDTRRETLTLVYESPGQETLDFPDNLTLAPNGDILICENGTPPDFIRGLTPEGRIYDFAKAVTNHTEIAGACFSADGRTLFVNQNGDRSDGGDPGVTYAIWGPFTSRARRDEDRRPGNPPNGGGRAGSGRDDGTPPGERTNGGGGSNGSSPASAGGARSNDDLGAPAAASRTVVEDGGAALPFTGLPLVTSASAAAVLIATGAVLRRRVEQARRRADAAGGSEPGRDAPPTDRL